MFQVPSAMEVGICYQLNMHMIMGPSTSKDVSIEQSSVICFVFYRKLALTKIEHLKHENLRHGISSTSNNEDNQYDTSILHDADRLEQSEVPLCFLHNLH